MRPIAKGAASRLSDFGASAADVWEERHFDAVIIGSGPVGSAFARKLVEGGLEVAMVDAGPRTSVRQGEHLKNAYKYHRDVNKFADHIRGALHTLSIPTNTASVPILDPVAFNPPPVAGGFVRGNQNPYQSASDNLPAAAATYNIESNWLFPSKNAYNEAEIMLRVNQESFMPYSVRDRVLNKVLTEAWKDRTKANPMHVREGAKYRDGPQPLPLAVQRNKRNPDVVQWTGADVVLGEAVISGAAKGSLTLLDNHVCKFLELDSSASEVKAAHVLAGIDGSTKRLTGDTFVLAAGTVLTPQLLWTSLHKVSPDATRILPALGRYLTEQPMAFCQVVWRTDIIEDEFKTALPNGRNLAVDPVPISMKDPDPNQWIPVTPGRPWHAQIHRDAFAYGDTAPNVDTRLVVDLRFFGIVDQRFENCVEFHTCQSKGINDIFGLPQPTVHYSYSSEEKKLMHDMMDDMCYYALKIGGFLPGSEPRFMPPGMSLHIHGSTRVGDSATDSVVSRQGQVHGMSNLYLGGNGLIPRGIACNPTLTSVAYALEASDFILRS